MTRDARTIFEDPERSRAAICAKPFLRAIYRDWYRLIAGRLPGCAGPIVELGSGGGLSRDYIPGAITSDIIKSSLVALVADGTKLPFGSSALRAIILVDALHHFPDVRGFFDDACRSLRAGGSLIMIEPWVSTWSRWVYKHLHYEHFDPAAGAWELPADQNGNNALAWIVFSRDREQFEREYPGLCVAEIVPMMPFRYLASGGVALPWSLPGWSSGLVRWIEKLLSPSMNHLALFALIEIRKR